MKILLVDDFEIVRVMIRETLSDLGYKDVSDAENGLQALTMIEEAHGSGQPFDLVFCDWNMPEMTGIEVLEKCRKEEKHKRMAVVMVTAESEQEFVVRALRAGAADYIVKPISPTDLERKLNKIVAKYAKVA